MTPPAAVRAAAALSATLLLLAAADGASAAPPRPQTTALAGDHLFISPSGRPYRTGEGQPYGVVAWFAAADTDHDAKLTKDEFRADAAAFFKVLDKNGDGLVTDPEIGWYEKVLTPELNQSADLADQQASDLTKASHDLQGAAPYALINDAEPVRSADDSFIGRISLKSFLSRADHNFDLLDTRGQGYLTLEALPRTQVQAAAEPLRRR